MITFKKFITEIFDKPVEATRDHEMEPMFAMFVPEDVTNLQVHHVNGMSDLHRVLSFTNKDNEDEHHIIHMLGAYGKLGTNDIDHKNASAAYNFIINRVKQSIENGKSVRLQSPYEKQIDTYKKTVNRLLAKNPGKAEVRDMGIQPTVQGVDAHTIKIKPISKEITESFVKKCSPRFRMKSGDPVIQL